MAVLNELDLREVVNLELLARQVVEGFIIGLHKSPFHGYSVEFSEHRIYNPGESTKNIDWKVYARTDKLFSKRYEDETNLRCQIVIDTSSSMYFPDMVKNKNQKLNKVRFSAVAAASLMNLLRKQRDAYGLSTFDTIVNIHTRCKSSTRHYNLLLANLEKVLADEQMEKKTSAADALHEISEAIHKRSLVVIFSDMMDSSKNSEELFSALQHLKYNNHEVVLFHVHDKRHEFEFEYENRPHIFVDLETNEKIKLMPEQVRENYKSAMEDYYKEMELKCLQYRIDFIKADINEGVYPILNAYLTKRKRMSI
jgi:uncharacterized protein (DUF58 family)